VNVDFTNAAEADIAAINREGIRQFGEGQARKYASEMAEAFEQIGEYSFASPGRAGRESRVRVRPFGAHIILYEIQDESVLILRIRHGHEDWQADD
jgi:toxin ParE1/3/4